MNGPTDIALSGDALQRMLVPPAMPLARTLEHMLHEAALVVDESGRLLGLVTDGDVRRAFLRGARLETPVGEIMTERPVTIPPSLPPQAARSLMLSRQVRHLPVVDGDGCPVGLVLLKRILDEDLAGTAVIMAGGKGSRLRPLTLDTPKPLLPIGDTTLLDNVLCGVRNSGIRDVVLTVNYLADKIRAHAGNGDRHALAIRYVEERKRLGTAGSLSLLDPHPDRAFLVMNADLMTDLDLGRLGHFHRESGNHATMCVKRHGVQIPYGVVEVEENTLRVRDVNEKPVREVYVNAGIYMLEPALLTLVPENTYLDMPTLLRRAVAAGFEVGAFPVLEYWQDVGRHEEMERAQAEWQRRHGAAPHTTSSAAMQRAV